jgi:lipopolysaccharide export LptBFGC system permease protein LptF
MIRHQSWTYIIVASIVIALFVVLVDVLRGHASTQTILVAVGWGVVFFVTHAALNRRANRR